ncbi:hypothetical protein V8G54_006399 [Vigna mungo]|uniref:Uncharacterized protein n=1 Tax=Vigna mungo TaxID=3915 RepID=A0AAQ3P1U2_VIGMU
MAVDYDFHRFHSLDLRQTARDGLVLPLVSQSPLRVFAASHVVLAPAPVRFLSVLESMPAYVLSNLLYSVVHPRSSWSPFGFFCLLSAPQWVLKCFSRDFMEPRH